MSKGHQTPAAAAGSITPAPRAHAPIAVRLLIFKKPTKGPGFTHKDSLTGGKKFGATSWEIEYLPHLRHHRVTCTSHSDRVVGMIHETAVAYWEPTEQ